MKTIQQLVDETKAVLEFYGAELPTSDTVIEMEVKSAIGVINRCRRFTPDSTLLYDVIYEDKIVPLAVTGFLKAGAEGETQHTENGISRQYGSGDKYPKDMLSDIIPLAKFQ
jgi:hypothetical protein